MSKSKAQGTAWESEIVKTALSAGLHAERVAEGGSKDIGDVRIGTGIGAWVVEAKARANLNVHQALADAQVKARHYSRVVVMWKRLVRQGDNVRRTATGERAIVAMSLSTFLTLIGGFPGEACMAESSDTESGYCLAPVENEDGFCELHAELEDQRQREIEADRKFHLLHDEGEL